MKKNMNTLQLGRPDFELAGYPASVLECHLLKRAVARGNQSIERLEASLKILKARQFARYAELRRQGARSPKPKKKSRKAL